MDQNKLKKIITKSRRVRKPPKIEGIQTESNRTKVKFIDEVVLREILGNHELGIIGLSGRSAKSSHNNNYNVCRYVPSL